MCRNRTQMNDNRAAVSRGLQPFSRDARRRKILALQSLTRSTVSPWQINGENGRKRSASLHDAPHCHVEHAFDQVLALGPGKFRIVDQRRDQSVQTHPYQLGRGLHWIMNLEPALLDL